MNFLIGFIAGSLFIIALIYVAIWILKAREKQIDKMWEGHFKNKS